MEYSIYKSSMEEFALLLRRHHKLGQLHEDEFWEFLEGAMRDFYRVQPDLIGSFDFYVHAEEYCFLTSDRACLFPESIELLQRISATDIDAFNRNFEPPIYNFILATPRGFEIDGVAVESVLVNVMQLSDLHHWVVEPFSEFIGSNCVIANENTSPDQSCIMLNVQYSAGDSVPIENRRYYRSQVPLGLILKHYNSVDRSAFWREYGVCSELSADELDHQFNVLRLVVGLIIFMSDAPDCIVGEDIPRGLDGLLSKAVCCTVKAPSLAS